LITSGSDPQFNFAFTLGSNIGFGSLNTDPVVGGGFWAFSGTLTVTGSSDPSILGTYSLLTGGPGATYTPSGAFIIDNVVYPSNPALDTYGLGFVGVGGLEINIWGNSPGNYSFYSYNGGGYNVAYTGTGTFAVPEPSALILLSCFALVGLGFSRRRKA
jgi:hypothetical protein